MVSILLIDDDPNLRMAYVDGLHECGYSDVSIAAGGHEGLDKALKEHPEIILLDIAMPDMDGISVMKKLREDTWGKTVPIILLTNMESDDTILQGVIEGQPVYYLLKVTMTPEDVAKKIKETLEKHAASSTVIS